MPNLVVGPTNSSLSYNPGQADVENHSNNVLQTSHEDSFDPAKFHFGLSLDDTMEDGFL